MRSATVQVDHMHSSLQGSDSSSVFAFFWVLQLQCQLNNDETPRSSTSVGDWMLFLKEDGKDPQCASTGFNQYGPQSAVDGDYFNFASTSAVAANAVYQKPGETRHWWRVDLQTSRNIAVVRVWARFGCDGCATENRMQNLEVVAGNSALLSENAVCASALPDPQILIAVQCPPGTVGRYVFLALPEDTSNNFVFGEVEVFEEYFNLARACAGSSCTTVTDAVWGTENEAFRGNDGDYDNFFHTPSEFQAGQSAHWWRVDLERSHSIGMVRVHNRRDCDAVDTHARQVAGVSCQTALESSSFMFKAVLNGRPGYENGAGKFLFWQESPSLPGTYRWYVSSIWGTATNIHAYADDHEAPPVSGWKEWCNGAWGNSPLSMVSTASKQVTGVSCQTSLGRSPFTYKATLNGKPGFENANARFLYCREVSAGTYRWYMGPNWDSTIVGAYSDSSDDTPPVSGWKEWCADAWTDSDLSIQNVGCSIPGRAAGFAVHVGDSETLEENPTCASNISAPQLVAYRASFADIACNARGRYVFISLPKEDYFHLSEVEIFGAGFSSVAVPTLSSRCVLSIEDCRAGGF